MLLNYLKYRYVKTRMIAYLDGELSMKSRRFVARQIDENPLCYREYILAKQTKQELERALPTIGKAEVPQLDKLWANIQQELSQSDEIIAKQPIRRPNYSLSYGFAVILFALLVLTPFAIDASRASISPIPQHPLPEETIGVTSRASTPSADARAIALATDTTNQAQVTQGSEIPLQNTPAPHTPRT